MLYFPTWKVTLVLVICALGAFFAVPNLFSPAALWQLPDWLPKRQVNLGLDLRGGSYVLYRVDMGAGPRWCTISSTTWSMLCGPPLDRDHPSPHRRIRCQG